MPSRTANDNFLLLQLQSTKNEYKKHEGSWHMKEGSQTVFKGLRRWPLILSAVC